MADIPGWCLEESPGCMTVSVGVTASSMSDLEVDIASSRLVVQDGGHMRSLDLPHLVDLDACTVKFKAKKQQLIFTLPSVKRQQLLDIESPNSQCELKGEEEGNGSNADQPAQALISEARTKEATSDAPGDAACAADDKTSAMLAELHEGRESVMILESEGNAAFGELRSLLAEGPTSLRDGVRKRLADGRINVTFCQVLRENIGHALDAGQQNKASAFRWIQKEIRAFITAPPKMSAREHAPQVDTTEQAAPRPVEREEILNAKPLREWMNADFIKKGSKAKGMHSRTSQLAEQVGRGLSSAGWVVLDGLFTDSEAADLRNEIEQLEPHFHASEIWVGHQAAVGAQMTVPEIRGDKILWMCGHHPKRSATPWSHSNSSQSAEVFEAGEDTSALQPCSSAVRQDMREIAMKSGGARRIQPSERWMNRNLARMLDALDALVLELRRSSTAGRCAKLDNRSDAMLAIYPARGTRFQRHVDNTAGDGRRLTCLCYMNREWTASDGGELCVFPQGSAPVSILPSAGRVVFLHADTMPHEVRPAYRHRCSVNVWYYDAEERDHAIEEARTTGRIGGQGGGAVTDEEQRAARSLLQSILNGDGPATAAEISRLADEAASLPPGAANMVAQVTMGSEAGKDTTPAEVARGLRSMTPEVLQTLRRSMNLMSHK